MKSIDTFLIMLAACFFPNQAKASNIIEVTALTNRIVLVHFDDGTVDYPNGLQVNRLDVTAAVSASSYALSSADDADYVSAASPVDVGRKSKGTEFVKDAPWGGNSFDPRSKPWASEHYIYLFMEKDLKAGKSYTLNTSTLAENGSQWAITFDVRQSRSEAVHVNTIGYETQAPKFGYVYQWMGDRGGLDLSDYAGNSFHLYKAGEEDAVFSGTIVKRKSATNAETDKPNDTPNKNFLGAEVYECDFSEVKADGDYTLAVEGIGCSYPFKIGKDALWEAYYTCARALYYQRSGIRLAPPFSEEGYIRPVNQNPVATSDDGTSFKGMLLYSNYPYMDWDDDNSGGDSQAVIRDSAIGKPLDVAGWYHDAGDWDSYYTHHRIPILLMTTFEFAPGRFADNDLNIPESGNGIPDIVDEASWLIKFNYRLRKELMAKGYSNGGVGGARICADVFTSVDGNAESDVPSWKEYRRTVVTKADAFMTYLYAGQAAQFGTILGKLGKDPNAFAVEMLDHRDLESMSRDTVDWEKEAKEAYAWASAAENQPASSNNYPASLNVYKMYAAASLYRLTNEEGYHADALAELQGLKSNSKLGDDERWGVYAYLLADNHGVDQLLQSSLKAVALSSAKVNSADAVEKRACRWGGSFSMPMLVGQATTPLVFESIVAFGLTGEKTWSDAVHTTADYFLGTNPLHTTWATQLGPRPAKVGFHLDSRYNNNWELYPGFVPYGPWSMDYDYVPYSWTIDGVSYEGGHGPWNKDWANFSMYPMMDQWPGHERWNSNIHAPMSSENTVHQNAVYVSLTYGFVNGRQNTNADADHSIGSITLDRSTMELTQIGEVDTLGVSIDIDNASFGMLKWESSDKRIAHVDGMGRVTGVTAGSCTIMCSTLDGSASAGCSVTCNWIEQAADSLTVKPDSLELVAGQTAHLEVFFYPDGVTNRFVDWSYSFEGIVEVSELGELNTLAPGMVWVTATSLNGGRMDSVYVQVYEAVDLLIADFDSIVPVLTVPQPDLPQLYAPNGGLSDVQADNPMVASSNESSKTVMYSRPEGDWKLIGMVMPTSELNDLGQFAQFQFKYYGAGIDVFYIQLVPETGDNYEVTTAVESEDCWKLFALDLDLSFPLKQFNIFLNPQGNGASLSAYFDDFKLTAEAASWYSDLSISHTKLDLVSGVDTLLVAEADEHPFSWLSTNKDVATVDQNGVVSAVSRGTAIMRAVPLYGEARECKVLVDGGGDPDPETYERKMILDFENYELDWTSGYGAFAWNSDTWSKTDNPDPAEENNSDKVITWYRDGTNYGGGFGVQFPSESTKGWERLSLQAYPEKPVSKILVELLDGDVKAGELEVLVDFPANRWSQKLFDLADMGALDVSFNKINFLFAVGTLDALNLYVDNVWLEKGENQDTTVVETTIGSPGTGSLLVYPNPSKGMFMIRCEIPMERIEVINMLGEILYDIDAGSQYLAVMEKLKLDRGIYLIRVCLLNGSAATEVLIKE